MHESAADILAPVVANRKGEQVELFAELRAQGGDSERSRERLLQAALSLFAGQGYAREAARAVLAYAQSALGLTRVVANEWAPEGIRVNVVCPFAATEGVVKWQEAFPERAAASVAKVPLGRIGDPETDIAPVVVFLASDDSKYMTGQTLMADGGSIKLR